MSHSGLWPKGAYQRLAHLARHHFLGGITSPKSMDCNFHSSLAVPSELSSGPASSLIGSKYWLPLADGS